jgi:hypothetical protein
VGKVALIGVDEFIGAMFRAKGVVLSTTVVSPGANAVSAGTADVASAGAAVPSIGTAAVSPGTDVDRNEFLHLGRR